MKKMNEYKQLAIVLLIVLGVGALMYSYFTWVGVNGLTRFYMLIGMASAFVFYLVTSLIKLKRDGILYDERDGYIEKKANAISHDVFRVVLMIIGLLTYTSQEITINISGLIFFIFGIMWVIDVIVHFVVKRKS